MGQSTCEHDAKPAVEAGQQAELSAPEPYEGGPPRLCPCLNGPTDEQPEPRLPDGVDAKPEHIEDILQWVAGRLLDCSLDDVWKNPGGQHPNEASFGDAEKQEEEWAKLAENMFFGTAYGGPDVMHSTAGKTGVHLGITEIYTRLAGANAATDDAVNTKQEDPAYSLWVACQHLSTYGALTRGVLLMEEMNGAGFPASQAAAALKLFQPGGTGTWYVHSEGAIEVDGKEASFKRAPATPHTVATVDGLKDGKGAGAIYTYNPLLDRKFALLRVPRVFIKDVDENGIARPDAVAIANYAHETARNSYKENMAQYQKDVARDRQLFDFAEKFRPALGPGSKKAAFTPAAPPTKVSPIAVLGSMADPDGVLVPLNYQFDGSHISMVLRSYVSRGKAVVQLLDTSSHHGPSPAHTDAAPAFAVLGKMDGSIVAGNAFTEVPAYTGGYFVGLGLLPALRDPEIVFDNLRRARPVGLGRLVITRASTAALKEDDVLFMSRMVPLWGDDEEQNFNLPRLLWSLRNTPYHETLKAHWFVYSPRGELAQVMWGGARAKSLYEMVDEAVRLIAGKAVAGKQPRDALQTGQDTMPVAVLSHETNGTCFQQWRNHGLKPGGVGTVDKLLRQYFIDAGPPAGRIAELYNAEAKARGVWVNERVGRIRANGKRLGQLTENSPERDALVKQNADLADEIRTRQPDFFAQLGAEKDSSGMQAHPLKIARDNLRATYVPKAWREQGLTLPPLFDLLTDLRDIA